jgi:ATP-dependent DNA helicase RecG
MAEDQNTEWKEQWRDEYLKTVCAFANTNGGTLDVGRNDLGTVIGVQNPGY